MGCCLLTGCHRYGEGVSVWPQSETSGIWGDAVERELMNRDFADKSSLGARRPLKRREARIGLAAAVGAVGLVVLAFLLVGGEDDEVEPDESPPGGFVEASASITGAVQLARERLESGEAAEMLKARRIEDALRAKWREGQAVELAGELQPDQSMYLALLGRQVPDPSIFRALSAAEEEFDFRRSRPGDKWHAWVDEEGAVTRLRYETSPEDIWETRYVEGEGYTSEKLDIEVEVKTRAVAGEVEGSFWLSMSRAGHSDVLALQFMRVFEYTIDFNTETRGGDKFALVFEEIYLDGELLRYGRVLAATYMGRYGHRQAYYFESDEESGYYDEEAESMQRMFLRSPLSVTRVTSNFGRRVHPITGDERMHRGVDYGAPEGTPVQAVAAGTVHFAGWRGGYGKLLILRHSGGWETRYAHLSGFGCGVWFGVCVI